MGHIVSARFESGSVPEFDGVSASAAEGTGNGVWSWRCENTGNGVCGPCCKRDRMGSEQWCDCNNRVHKCGNYHRSCYNRVCEHRGQWCDCNNHIHKNGNFCRYCYNPGCDEEGQCCNCYNRDCEDWVQCCNCNNEDTGNGVCGSNRDRQAALLWRGVVSLRDWLVMYVSAAPDIVMVETLYGAWHWKQGVSELQSVARQSRMLRWNWSGNVGGESP